MIADHISQLICKELKFEPTESQFQLINGFGDFLMSRENNDLLVVKGYAGTGKTWVLSALVRALSSLDINTVLLAPTGRAAKVFSNYASAPAFTIHKVIYRQQTSGSQFGRFNLNWNRSKDTVFIVDEASMISNSAFENSIFGSGRLLEDLFEFVQQGNNCKLIIIGDTAQLPPIGIDQSPALDRQVLEYLGYEVREYFLSEVIRQKKESLILKNATELRDLMEKIVLENEVPILHYSTDGDVECVTGENLIDKISYCYDNYGEENTMVICRSNKRAYLYNKGIRGSVLFREEELTVSDYLMVVKNNYYWSEKIKEIDFIANGDIAQIVRILGYEELYGFRFANVTLRFPDYEFLEMDVKIILDVLTIESAGFSKEQNNTFYNAVMEDYQNISNKRKQMEELRKNPYFNALQVKYGYAITCHKSQGGQWPAVFIDQGMIRDEDKGVEYLRWLYTAITRSTEKLYLVNFPDNQIQKMDDSN